MKSLVVLCGLCFVLAACDANKKPVYNGETGAPVNCRAIIKENISAWRAAKISANDAMESIDRNCGEFGVSW